MPSPIVIPPRNWVDDPAGRIHPEQAGHPDLGAVGVDPDLGEVRPERVPGVSVATALAASVARA
jgi:hypothetical protein